MCDCMFGLQRQDEKAIAELQKAVKDAKQLKKEETHISAKRSVWVSPRISPEQAPREM